MGNKAAAVDFSEAPPHINEWRRFLRVFFSRGMVAFGLVVLVLMIIAAVFANWLAPYDPIQNRLQQFSVSTE